MQPIPSLNVNINATHAHPCSADPTYCDADCRSVLIPCPVPRSVTFEVVLGKPCTAPPQYHHHSMCNQPVRVSCSISGKTWEESEVFAAEASGHADDSPILIGACRERWALVKALVLGEVPAATAFPTCLPLIAERDARFAELVDMARAERVLLERWLAIPIGYRTGPGPTRFTDGVLARYVALLIEQVGVL